MAKRVMRDIAVATGLLLMWTTDALEALGLPRETAGAVATAAVSGLVVYGLYLFATRVIDW